MYKESGRWLVKTSNFNKLKWPYYSMTLLSIGLVSSKNRTILRVCVWNYQIQIERESKNAKHSTT